jgi:hypothetical protein
MEVDTVTLLGFGSLTLKLFFWGEVVDLPIWKADLCYVCAIVCLLSGGSHQGSVTLTFEFLDFCSLTSPKKIIIALLYAVVLVGVVSVVIPFQRHPLRVFLRTSTYLFVGVEVTLAR